MYIHNQISFFKKLVHPRAYLYLNRVGEEKSLFSFLYQQNVCSIASMSYRSADLPLKCRDFAHNYIILGLCLGWYIWPSLLLQSARGRVATAAAMERHVRKTV